MVVFKILIGFSILHATFGFLFQSQPTSVTSDYNAPPNVMNDVTSYNSPTFLNRSLQSWVLKFLYCLIFGDHSIRLCSNQATRELYHIPSQGTGIFDYLKSFLTGNMQRYNSYQYPTKYRLLQLDQPDAQERSLPFLYNKGYDQTNQDESDESTGNWEQKK